MRDQTLTREIFDEIVYEYTLLVCQSCTISPDVCACMADGCRADCERIITLAIERGEMCDD